MKKRAAVFLGYRQEDAGRVHHLSEDLRAQDLITLEGQIDIDLGAEGKSFVREVISGCDFLLLCLSGNAVTEGGGLQEHMTRFVQLLWKQRTGKVYLIPVRLDDCPVPKILTGLELIDLFEDGGVKTLLTLIAEVIDGRVEIEISAETRESTGDSPADLAASDGEESSEGPEDPTSVSSWESDLRMLLGGRREYRLLQLGGVRNYIAVELEEADDPLRATDAFHQALRNVVQSWNPSSHQSPHLDPNLMLDLIQSYTPPGGFIKGLQFLQEVRRNWTADRSVGLRALAGDIRSKALVVLEKYFPFAPLPQDQSMAFEAYVDALREEILYPERAGYALSRMIKLKQLHVFDEEVRRLVRKSHAVVQPVLALLLDRGRQYDVEEDLSQVYVDCLDAGNESERAYENAVIACGGQFERRGDRPVIHIFGRSIELIVPSDVQWKYFTITLDREQEGGSETFYGMSANA